MSVVIDPNNLKSLMTGFHNAEYQPSSSEHPTLQTVQEELSHSKRSKSLEKPDGESYQKNAMNSINVQRLASNAGNEDEIQKI